MTDVIQAPAIEAPAPEWKPTACILCECNCGIEVRLGEQLGTSRRFERIRGDKAHPASKGYTCEKALRLDHYQNGANDRVLGPLRKRPDGTFEEIDWDTAIREVAERLGAVRDTYGGESILYYGGGGQGNHLGGAYGAAMFRAFGGRYRSSALAQEKTGEFWVNGRMLGTMVRADFEHAEVALFLGKNPWQSHSIPHARTTLKEISNDPTRALIVIDPRCTETADLAESNGAGFHLQVKPGRDAWLIGALAAVIAQERLHDAAWLADHAAGVEQILGVLGDVPVGEWCAISGVAEERVRAAARRIAAADSVAVFEDLGVQHNRYSTLVSYLEKLVWLLTGNFAKPGAQYSPTALVPLAKAKPKEVYGAGPVTPVTGSKIISGLMPANVIPEEILADHPARFRALIVESGNPVHSIADSHAMRAAVDALDVLVVIDVSLTETARLADYVLPAATQFEKYEATFFNFEFPRNVFHLRHPLLDAPPGVFPEPEIHARLVEASGALTTPSFGPVQLAELQAAALRSRAEFAGAFFEALAAEPALGVVAPIVLYRTLGPALDAQYGPGAGSAAVLWAAAHKCAQLYPEAVRRAGFGPQEGDAGLEAGEALFEAILTSPSGVVISEDAHEVGWQRIGTPDGLIQLVIPELLDELATLATATPPGDDPEWPFLLSAGERRSFTANTIIRDQAWRKRDPGGALRVSEPDATRLGLADGAVARLTTGRSSAVVNVAVDRGMQPGHLAIPNGYFGNGAEPNEFTASADRDWLAGTPWHKTVPAKLEPV
ncbi:MAG TPA: molybdopterin-dependent oxidoreductase [Ilumatobacter sp.]|nr:molybdopterin-dependent oxidoreductase [Ilumatobacter sp.]